MIRGLEMHRSLAAASTLFKMTRHAMFVVSCACFIAAIASVMIFSCSLCPSMF